MLTRTGAQTVQVTPRNGLPTPWLLRALLDPVTENRILCHAKGLSILTVAGRVLHTPLPWEAPSLSNQDQYQDQDPDQDLLPPTHVAWVPLRHRPHAYLACLCQPRSGTGTGTGTGTGINNNDDHHNDDDHHMDRRRRRRRSPRPHHPTLLIYQYDGPSATLRLTQRVTFRRTDATRYVRGREREREGEREGERERERDGVS